MQIREVGLAGGGIDRVCAQAGHQTAVLEVALEFLDRGLGTARKTLGGARVTRLRDRYAGLRFFNAATRMELVEVSRIIRPGDLAVTDATALPRPPGRQPILAKDRAWFPVNPLPIPYLRGANRVLETGLATAEDSDAGMVLRCDHPMGPPALLSVVGRDTTYSATGAWPAGPRARSAPRPRCRNRRSWPAPAAGRPARASTTTRSMER